MFYFKLSYQTHVTPQNNERQVNSKGNKVTIAIIWFIWWLASMNKKILVFINTKVNA